MNRNRQKRRFDRLPYFLLAFLSFLMILLLSLLAARGRGRKSEWTVLRASADKDAPQVKEQLAKEEKMAVSTALAQREEERAATETAAGGGRETQALFPVYLCGSVVNPGVYEVAEGAIVADVLARAGGFDVGADTKQVNLAALLRPHEQIVIPRQGEKLHQAGEEGLSLWRDSGQTSRSDEGGSSMTDLNTASESELLTVPGIGPETAKAIIQSRMSEGNFRTLEDLMRVRGIKEKRLEQLRPYLRISGP